MPKLPHDSTCPDSWSILKKVLDDDVFEGGELARFGEYTVSWDTIKGLVAIADSHGWWVMDAHQLKEIAAATPNPLVLVADPNDELRNCKQCDEPGIADHTCPHAEEIAGNSTTLCNCCKKCMTECANDI